MGPQATTAILVVDDEPAVTTVVSRWLEAEGYECERAASGEQALEALRRGEFALVVTDIMMPGMSGMELLKRVRRASPDTAVIMLTAVGDRKTATDALELGAYGYIIKPFEQNEILINVANALKRRSLEMLRDRYEEQLERTVQERTAEIRRLKERVEAENVYLRDAVRTAHLHAGIVGRSHAIRSVMAQAEQVARTDSTVLILGETGTGKELLARAIHNMSPRSEGPFVVVNCAAMPATLVESELFGREKGAYTGALDRQIGRFEIAEGGTVFLDEIGELPPEVQAKLLRVLDRREIQRVGGTETISVDVRVLAATNRNLEEELHSGRFRQDLFYRLNVFPITLPPLRERSDDIPALVAAFVDEFNGSMGKRVEGVSRASMEALRSYRWPGNVRELRNTIERAMIRADGGMLSVSVPPDAAPPPLRGGTLAEVERRYIREVLESTGWRVRGEGGAAQILGLKPSTLEFRMKKLGIVRPK